MAVVIEVRVWNNGDEIDCGSLGTFEMTDDATHEVGDVIYDDQANIQLRLLEAININLASIAETLERIHRGK